MRLLLGSKIQANAMQSWVNGQGSRWTVGPQATPLLEAIFKYSPHRHTSALGIGHWLHELTWKTGGAIERRGEKSQDVKIGMRCSGLSHSPGFHHLEAKADAGITGAS
jgi:hypothetical protein